MSHEEILRDVRKFVRDTPVDTIAVIIVVTVEFRLLHVYKHGVFVGISRVGFSQAPPICALNQREINRVAFLELEAVSLLHAIDTVLSPPAIKSVKNFLFVVVKVVVFGQGDMDIYPVIKREREVIVIRNVLKRGEVFGNNFVRSLHGSVASIPTSNRASVVVD